MKKIFLLLGLITFVSCVNTTQETINGPILEFKLNETPTNIFSDTSVEFISFNCDGRHEIGSIDQVIESGDTIIISDLTNYQVSAYTKDGHFISNIGRRGKGHGEYMGLASVFIDNPTKQIGIYDEETCRLIYYNRDTFEYLYENSYKDIQAGCCLPIKTDLIWYNESHRGRYSDDYFLISSKSGEIKQGLVNKSFKSGYISGNTLCLYPLNGNIYGYAPYNTTLYNLTEKQAIPIYTFKFGNFNSPSTDFLNKISRKGTSSSLFKLLSNSDFISYYDIVEGNNILVATIIVKKQKYFAILNKTTKDRTLLKSEEFAEKLGLGKINYFIGNSIDGSVVAILDTESINKQLNSRNKNKLNPSISAYADSTGKITNPIIAKISFPG